LLTVSLGSTSEGRFSSFALTFPLSFKFDIMGSIQQESHFKKLHQFKANYADATFTQYESQRTGLRVVVVDRKGPKVYGNFAVATEIHDDSGARECLGLYPTRLY
jgi:hypothetical protein